MELIDAHASLQSEVEYLQDQGTTNQMATIYPDVYHKYEEARTAVVEAVEKLERDAARYRWLRDNATHDVEPEHIVVMYRALSFVWDSPSFEAGKRLAPVPLDAAIDAAMKEATNGQGN